MLKSLPDLIQEVAGHVRAVDVRTAREEARENGGLIIDVREPPEVAEQASPGTVAIPRGVLEVKLPELVSEPSRPLYLHCASGGRARLSAEQLQRMGYENVTAISCGIETVCDVLSDG